VSPAKREPGKFKNGKRQSKARAIRKFFMYRDPVTDRLLIEVIAKLGIQESEYRRQN
jgi:hypothetical protein